MGITRVVAQGQIRSGALVNMTMISEEARSHGKRMVPARGAANAECRTVRYRHDWYSWYQGTSRARTHFDSLSFQILRSCSRSSSEPSHVSMNVGLSHRELTFFASNGVNPASILRRSVATSSRSCSREASGVL